MRVTISVPVEHVNPLYKTATSVRLLRLVLDLRKCKVNAPISVRQVGPNLWLAEGVEACAQLTAHKMLKRPRVWINYALIEEPQAHKPLVHKQGK